MHRSVGIFALASAVLLAPGAHANPPPEAPTAKKHTLPELVAMARKNSRAVEVARADLLVRESQKRQALWLWTPTGDLTYAFTGAPRIECRGPGNNADPTIRIQECVDTVDPATGQPSSTISSGIHGVAMQGELHLLQPLYTFGKIEGAVAAARHGIDAASALVDGAQRDAELDVNRAYWGAKGTSAAIEMLDSVREEVKPWIDKIEKDLEKPKPHYTISDLQRLKTAMDDIEAIEADLAKGHAVALAGLRALCGEDVDVDDVELDPVPAMGHPFQLYERTALTLRPEVKALAAGSAAFHSLARVARNQLFPDIGISIDVLLRYVSSVETPDNVFMWRATTAQFAVFLGARWSLDFFQKTARLKTARAEAGAFDARRDLALTGIEFEVRQAFAEQEEARKRIAILDHGQRTARGWLTAVKSSLDLGTAEPRDLADAARKYIELRLRYFLAIVDTNVSTARLRRVSAVVN
jgi:outer membrane protein TolC